MICSTYRVCVRVCGHYEYWFSTVRTTQYENVKSNNFKGLNTNHSYHFAKHLTNFRSLAFGVSLKPSIHHRIAHHW